ncbi:MAG: hypothetical protein KTR31_41450 [Myxococcales bacterium]|nr:hypothetical protein [Myxococcales bacterium]
MTASVGIDAMAVYVPRLYLDMRDFAELRAEDYGKLRNGLGLVAMSIPDVHEDTATMGANAVARLIDDNGLDPRRIGRLYLGTESGLDGSKPTATYVLQMLTQRYAPTHGDDCFAHCDVVDLTFACIGGVDALHNVLDWVARGGEAEDRIGVVVSADNAKYELGSPGEYTQGAGGSAVLVSHHPRLLAIDDRWGVCTHPVHDFFKPRRRVAVQQLIDDVLAVAREAGSQVPEDLSRVVRQRLFAEGPAIEIHKDTPVFDGQLSNACYRAALTEAFADFQRRAIADGRHSPDRDPPLTEQWRRILLHLPYAYQGKRMFPDVFLRDRVGRTGWSEVADQAGLGPEDAERPIDDDMRRRVSKTEAYRTFVADRIERGQRASSLIGNQYTGSIFTALMSTLASDLHDGTDLAGCRVGFFGYGSGAKAKVFEGTVAASWREAAGLDLFGQLQARHRIGCDVYEQLHRGMLQSSVMGPRGEFAFLGTESGGAREGARRYAWVA